METRTVLGYGASFAIGITGVVMNGIQMARSGDTNEILRSTTLTALGASSIALGIYGLVKGAYENALRNTSR